MLAEVTVILNHLVCSIGVRVAAEEQYTVEQTMDISVVFVLIKYNAAVTGRFMSAAAQQKTLT